jgi:t-SNARE syntaxin family protein
MDPFIEVLQDAQQQCKTIAQLIRTTVVSEESTRDFENNMQELHETITDLKESIESSKSDPEFFKITQETIGERETIVNGLNKQYQEIEAQWEQKKTSTTTTPFTQDEETAQFNQVQQQEIIREQDEHLDGVYVSMQTINQQARAMGNELEEQAFIMEELEGDLDRITGRIGRGLKRVEHVIRMNQDTASNCCIGLLIVALIVLLVMVIVV